MPFPGKGAVLIELSGRIAFASTYFCDLVGVDHDKIGGTSYFDFVYPDDKDEARKMFKSTTTVSAEASNLRLRRADGAVVWVEIRGAALADAHGEIYAISATVTASEQAVSDEVTPPSRPQCTRKPKSRLHFGVRSGVYSKARRKGRRSGRSGMVGGVRSNSCSFSTR